MQVDKGRVIQETLLRLRRLSEGEGILLQPFKKDRSLVLIAMEDGKYQVLQRGFGREDFVVETGKIRKLLKVLCRKEFPRSNRVWLTVLGAESVAEISEKYGM